MTSIQLVSDERLTQIAAKLQQARAPVATDPQASYLIELSADDAELFDASLKSGEFLSFLDRNPQLEAKDSTASTADYSWGDFASEGKSIAAFVEEFRPTLGTQVDTKDPINAMIARIKSSQKALQASGATATKSSFRFVGDPDYRALLVSGSVPRKRSSDTFANLLGTHATAALTAARLRAPAKVNAFSTEKVRSPAEWSATCVEILGLIAQHAGIPLKDVQVAGERWLHEVKAGQQPQYELRGGAVVKVAAPATSVDVPKDRH